MECCDVITGVFSVNRSGACRLNDLPSTFKFISPSYFEFMHMLMIQAMQATCTVHSV